MYDILMLAVLGGCVLFGAWKGMAWQLASLASLVVSYLVALQFADVLAPMIGAEEPWNRFAAMAILYAGSSMAIWMLFRVLASAIDRVKMREFDRQLGALFGALKGVLLCVAITFFAVTLSSTARGIILESKSGYYIGALLDRVHPLIPEGMHETLHPHFEEFERKLKPDGSPQEGEQPSAPQKPFLPFDSGYATGGSNQATQTSAQLPVSQPPNPGISAPGKFEQWMDGIDTARRVTEAVQGTSSPATSPPAQDRLGRLSENIRWLGNMAGFRGVEAVEADNAPPAPNTSTRPSPAIPTWGNQR